MKINKPCKGCGEMFESYECQNKKYCSMKCRNKDYVGKFRKENSGSWKGDKASYSAFHYRVEAERGKPSKCEECGTKTAKKFEWANLTGKYEDVNDYKRLCNSCHRKLDKSSTKELITTICKQCGKEMKNKPWIAKTKKFCNSKCYWESMKGIDPMKKNG